MSEQSPKRLRERSVVVDVLAHRGQSPAWLARALRMTTNSLLGIEHGRRQPPEDYYEAVALILGIPPVVLWPEEFTAVETLAS